MTFEEMIADLLKAMIDRKRKIAWHGDDLLFDDGTDAREDPAAWLAYNWQLIARGDQVLTVYPPIIPVVVTAKGRAWLKEKTTL